MAVLSECAYSKSPYSKADLLAQIATFPEGHFTVEGPDGIPVGMSACLLVADSEYPVDAAWSVATDGGRISNHNPNGDVLYGVDTIIRHSLRGSGLGKALLQKRIELAHLLGGRTLRSGARLTGFPLVAHRRTPHEYANSVVAGRTRDPSISLCLSLGFKLRCVVSGYLEDDPESLGFAAIMEYSVAASAHGEGRA